MKKTLSLLLCALMVVGVLAPCFTGSVLAAEEIAVGYSDTINFADSADHNRENNAKIVDHNGTVTWNKPGFMVGEYTSGNHVGKSFITLWGATRPDDHGNEHHGAWDYDVAYEVPFEVPVTGIYTFGINGSFDNTPLAGDKPNAWEDAYVPVRIDDTEGKMKLVYNYTGANTFTAFANVYLEEGEHVFYLQKHVNCLKTNYYWSFTYTLNATADDMAGKPGTYEFTKFVDNQPTLFNQKDEFANNGRPLWGKDGFLPTVYREVPAFQFFGNNGEVDGVKMWTYAETSAYQVPFYVQEAGSYNFDFVVSYENKQARADMYTPIKIDDTTYKMATPANTTGTLTTLKAAENVYLEAGVHMLYVGTPNTTDNHYYHTFTYKRVAGAVPAPGTYNLKDFAEEQTTLYNQTEYMASHNGQPDWGKEGFSIRADGSLLFWGPNGEVNGRKQWTFDKGGCYKIQFTAPADGTYSFKFDYTYGNKTSASDIYTPIKIDDAEYKLETPANTSGKHYIGEIADVELTKGVHTLCIYPQTSSETYYYYTFAYELTSGELPTDDPATPPTDDPVTPPTDDPVDPPVEPPVDTPDDPTDDPATPTIDPEAYVAEGPGTYNILDFAAYQPTLFNQTETMASTGKPMWNKDGFLEASDGSLMFFGTNAGGKWTYAETSAYQIPFTVPADGTYTFHFDFSYENKESQEGVYTPVKIAGTEYKIETPANTRGEYLRATFESIELTAGTHMILISPPTISNNHYYYTFTYSADADKDKVVIDTNGYVAEEPGTYDFTDFADYQPTLFNQTETMANSEKGQPAWGKEGFSVTEYEFMPCIMFWGPNGDVDGIKQWTFTKGGAYQLAFTVPEDGTYSFSFDVSYLNKTSRSDMYTPIKIDAETYELYTPMSTHGSYETIGTIEGVELTAGVHMMYVYPPNTTDNHYYHSFTYELEGDEPEPPETDAPETDAPETDPPETDAPETDAPETDAPETDAPETDAPETDAPETDAPETDAPETDKPDEPKEPMSTDTILGIVLIAVAAVIVIGTVVFVVVFNKKKK